MREPADRTSRYPQRYAFVVQFEHPPGAGDGRAGRVEHLTSGRAARFESVVELMEFVAEVLASAASDRGDQANPPPVAPD